MLHKFKGSYEYDHGIKLLKHDTRERILLVCMFGFLKKHYFGEI
jgi:hypothetical protein